MKKILLVLLTLGMLCGCQGKKEDKITIGVILPLTGELSGFGSLIKEDILLAYKMQDTSKYKLEFIDSKSESKTALLGLNKLISSSNVKYLIGDVSSSVTMSLIPMINKHQILLLSPGASSPNLYNVSPFFARNYPSDIQESKDVAQYVYTNYQDSTIAIVYSNSEYGKGLYNGFMESYLLPHRVLLEESYDISQTDFKAILSKLKSSKVKVLYLAGEEKGMGRFMKQYKDMHLNCKIISNINFIQPSCLNLAGYASEGVVIPLVKFAPEDTTYMPTYHFAKRYKEIKGIEPSLVNAIAFDALTLMIHVIENTDNVEEAAKYLRHLKKYNGALGVLDFENGDVRIPVEFMTIENNKVVKITSVH